MGRNLFGYRDGIVHRHETMAANPGRVILYGIGFKQLSWRYLRWRCIKTSSPA